MISVDSHWTSYSSAKKINSIRLLSICTFCTNLNSFFTFLS
nr:MAG TPA: hypothetical protein [Microviridae sp.]